MERWGWKGVTSDGRVIGDIEMWLARWLTGWSPQKAAPTMPYSAQLAPTASAKRRFVEFRFPVKNFDVGYTRENVNGVGIFGNGGPCKKQSKKQSVNAQLGHVLSHLQPTDGRSVLARHAPPFPIHLI